MTLFNLQKELCVVYNYISLPSKNNQLWSGFGPPGTSRCETVWNEEILFFFLDSTELRMAEWLRKNMEEYLVLELRSFSSLEAWSILWQLKPWISSSMIITIRKRIMGLWNFMSQMMEQSWGRKTWKAEKTVFDCFLYCL